MSAPKTKKVQTKKAPCSLCHQVVTELKYHYDICGPCHDANEAELTESNDEDSGWEEEWEDATHVVLGQENKESSSNEAVLVDGDHLETSMDDDDEDADAEYDAAEKALKLLRSAPSKGLFSKQKEQSSK